MNILQSIEETICSADRLNDEGVPSASIVIQHSSDEIETRVITNGKENSETLYQACSISKAITGLAVAKLVDEGKISYDTKVFDYVPEAIRNSITPTHLLAHVTVEQILSHHSGLSRGGMPGYPEGQDMPTYEEMFAGVAPSNTERIRFLSFPGAQFSYSGGAFTLLQVVLENLTGKPFPEFMKETVLEPLGMTRSHFGDLPADEENYTKAHHTAYTLAGKISRGHHRFLELAAAGLWTTPTDLTRALIAVQKSLHVDGGFLTKATAQKMLTAVNPNCPEQKDIALGFAADDAFFGHSGGNWPGFSCYAAASHARAVNHAMSAGETRKDDFGNGSIVIMTNADFPMGIPTFKKLLFATFYKAGWPRVESLPSGFGPFVEVVPYAAPSHGVQSDKWKDWVGVWSHGWEVIAGDLPRVRFCGFTMKLLTAAMPTCQHRPEHIFVVEGLKTALWLTFDKDEPIIQLVQNMKQTLRRV